MSFKLRRDRLERKQVKQFDETFWNENYPKLQQYCRFLAQNTWDGDDIAHETYLKSLKYDHKQQKLTAALVNKIAYHHWIDQLRKRKNEILGVEGEIANRVIKNDLDELSNSVELLLKHLTPKQAVIFLLKEAFQYQGKEIADMLATTEMAVKASLQRAKRSLEKENKHSIESFWDEEEKLQLTVLIYEALKTQDPSVLIQSIPSIRSLMEVSTKGHSKYTPSSTLCMAA